MIIAITVGYVAIVFLAFKLIKIKLGRVSIPAAALIGLFLMTLTTVAWKMSAPMSDQILLSREILIITSDVVEKVSKVHVKSNDMVKKGDPLFGIRPDRFQHAVDQATASLDAAKSTVSQLEADVVAAQAAVKQEAAETATAKVPMKATACSRCKAGRGTSTAFPPIGSSPTCAGNGSWRSRTSRSSM